MLEGGLQRAFGAMLVGQGLTGVCERTLLCV